MKENLIKVIPEFIDAKNAIERIRQKGFPKYNDSVTVNEYIHIVSKVITEEFGILPNFMTKLPRENFLFKIFRVRPVDSFENINLFSQHSYPPINVVGFGRCNFPQYPVFYGSNNAMTALLEVARENKGLNKKYCISKWEIESKDDIIFQSFIQAKLIDNSDYDELRELQRKKINTPFENRLTKGQCDGIILLLEFLDKSFITDSNYSLSACLAHRAIYSTHSHETDILMYPSIQTQYTGINLAIHPNYVDNNMQLKRMYIMDLENYELSTREINFSITNYGEVIRNQVIWTNVNPNDQKYKEIIKEDFPDIWGQDTKLNFEKL